MKFEEERQFLQQSISQLQFESKAQLDKTQRELLLLNNDHENLQAIHAEKIDQLRSLQESSEISIQNQVRNTNKDIHLELIQKRLLSSIDDILYSMAIMCLSQSNGTQVVCTYKIKDLG